MLHCTWTVPPVSTHPCCARWDHLDILKPFHKHCDGCGRPCLLFLRETPDSPVGHIPNKHLYHQLKRRNPDRVRLGSEFRSSIICSLCSHKLYSVGDGPRNYSIKQCEWYFVHHLLTSGKHHMCLVRWNRDVNAVQIHTSTIICKRPSHVQVMLR